MNVNQGYIVFLSVLGLLNFLVLSSGDITLSIFYLEHFLFFILVSFLTLCSSSLTLASLTLVFV